MSSLKVYVEDNSRSYNNMFLSNGWKITRNLEEADLLQLVGGADVSPHFYGEAKHSTTSCNAFTDTNTEYLYQKALLLGIPIAGICRGSQFLSIMGGGAVWQHVDNHAIGSTHPIEDVATGEIIPNVSSTHHQQHRPGSNAIIIAIASPQRSTYKCTGTQLFHTRPDGVHSKGEPDYLHVDVEAFYYEHTKALGYQPHPEFFDKEHPCQAYYFKLIEKYLNLTAQ